MKNTLKAMGLIFLKSEMESKSSTKYDLFETRVRQACSDNNVLSFINNLSGLMKSPALDGELISKIIIEESGSEIVPWIRDNLKIAVSLAHLSYKKDGQENYENTIRKINLLEYKEGDRVTSRYIPDIPIEIKLLTPLHHGSDIKAGNASLFRRTKIMAENGGIIEMPYYAGNAFRGRMRDLLARDLTERLGLKADRINPPYSTWFFYLLYSGGNLGGDKEVKKSAKKTGETIHGYNLNKIAGFRDLFPMLSVFGFGFSNSLYPGKFASLDYLPKCQEMRDGNYPSYKDMLTWEYLTRRDDLVGQHDKNTSMIANFELMKAGNVIIGGIDYNDNITDIEKHCLHLGIKLMQESGRVGAASNRGWGFTEITTDKDLSSDLYEKFIEDNKEKILDFIKEIGGFEIVSDRTPEAK